MEYLVVPSRQHSTRPPQHQQPWTLSKANRQRYGLLSSLHALPTTVHGPRLRHLGFSATFCPEYRRRHRQQAKIKDSNIRDRPPAPVPLDLGELVISIILAVSHILPFRVQPHRRHQRTASPSQRSPPLRVFPSPPSGRLPLCAACAVGNACTHQINRTCVFCSSSLPFLPLILLSFPCPVSHIQLRPLVCSRRNLWPDAVNIQSSACYTLHLAAYRGPSAAKTTAVRSTKRQMIMPRPAD